MDNTAIAIAVAASIVALIVIVLIGRFLTKRPWILFVCAAGIGIMGYATKNPDWYVGTAALAIWWVIALSSKRKSTKKGAPKKAAAKDAPKGPRYKSLADFADKVEADRNEIDANIHAVFCNLAEELGNAMDETKSEYGRAILSNPVAALERIQKAEIADKDEPLMSSIFDLAEYAEEKKVKLDPAIRAMLAEVYDYCEIFDVEADDDCALTDVAYDLERTLYPNGLSEAQSEAAGKRQGKLEEAIKAKMERAAP